MNWIEMRYAMRPKWERPLSTRGGYKPLPSLLLYAWSWLQKVRLQEDESGRIAGHD